MERASAIPHFFVLLVNPFWKSVQSFNHFSIPLHHRPLGRLVDKLVGDPSCDVFGIWGSQAENDVRETSVDGFSDRVPGIAGLVIRDRHGGRPGDRSGIATDLDAEAVQESTSTDGIIDVAAGDVP